MPKPITNVYAAIDAIIGGASCDTIVAIMEIKRDSLLHAMNLAAGASHAMQCIQRERESDELYQLYERLDAMFDQKLHEPDTLLVGS